MSTPARPSENPQEDPKQKERMSALEGIKSQLANLRSAVEKGPATPETKEEVDEQSAAEALDALAEAFGRARALHEGLESKDAAQQAWLNVEQAILGNTEGEPITSETLARGLEDAVDKTDSAQQELANLAGDIADEEGAVQEYLDRFRLSPDERMESAIDNVLEKAKKNENLAPMIAKAESLFRSVGIDFEDVYSFLKQYLFNKLENAPFPVGWVRSYHLRKQIDRLTDDQKKLVTPEIGKEWENAYDRWANNLIKSANQRPYLEAQGDKLVVVEPAVQQEQAAATPENTDVFGVSGLRLNQPLSIEGNPGFGVQVTGANVSLKLGEVERGGKKFKFEDKNDKSTRITLNTLTPKSATDAGQIDVLLSTGETIQLVQLVGHLDKAIADQKGGEAKVEFTVGSRTISASSGQATA